MVDERQQQLRAESLARAQSAVASEGLQPTPEDVAILDRWAAGDLSAQEAEQKLMARAGLEEPLPVPEQTSTEQAHEQIQQGSDQAGARGTGSAEETNRTPGQAGPQPEQPAPQPGGWLRRLLSRRASS